MKAVSIKHNPSVVLNRLQFGFACMYVYFQNVYPMTDHNINYIQTFVQSEVSQLIINYVIGPMPSSKCQIFPSFF